MAIEDARLFGQDIHLMLVDFTSAFNMLDQDKLLMLMYDLGYPTDAVDAVKGLYTDATTTVKTAYGPTPPIPVQRGTIQGDSLSPFLFLLYIYRASVTVAAGWRPWVQVWLPAGRRAGKT